MKELSGMKKYSLYTYILMYISFQSCLSQTDNNISGVNLVNLVYEEFTSGHFLSLVYGPNIG